jgi:electron transfer flavoprotein-quinone oxidoreductase
MTSGKLAGEAIIAAKETGDYSASTLKLYDEKIKVSFIHKDLKKYKGMHQFLKEQDPSLLFEKIPQAVNEAAYNMFLIDGKPKADKQKKAIQIVKGAAGGTMKLLKLGYKGWRAMNG